ncbi:MAG: cation diffusion facilitator family transporter [Casimicrobiaceae bacterium]
MAESKTAVYGAIAANTAIAITKFIVAGMTGSSAMLSEGIHSAVDTGNGLLLLVGMKLSKRGPTPQHPFGHGKELYFWSLIVAVLIFGLGGGISIYEGILHMRHPEPLKEAFWSYVVLGAAAVFEGASLAVAFRAFMREKGTLPFWRALRLSKDPTTFTVLAEDSAAMAGLAAAAIGVYASHALDMPIIDGAASVVIGLLLSGVAVLLIRESRGLLIGEGLRPETVEVIRGIVQGNPHVRDVGELLSMYIGAEDALLTLDVHFKPGTPFEKIASAVAAIEREIQTSFPKIKRIYIEAGAIHKVAEPGDTT